MKLFHAIPKPALYVAISIVTAVIIVLGGLALRGKVLEVSSQPDAVLNDTRSPIAAESTPITIAQPKQPDASGIIRGKVPTPIPIPEAITELPDASAYPQEDLSQKSPVGATSTEPPVVGIPDTEHGHLPYEEAKPGNLTSIGSFVRENYERAESLDYEAAQAFVDMQEAADIQGVQLIPISGFRSRADQEQLFDNQIARKGSPKAAAEFSAPPGHSEHHTGYAIDIGDANQPETDIKYSFEETPAYQWLLQSAAVYGFEQSFPKGNIQGITFEPWHWRYVGSQRASEVFAPAQVHFPVP